VSAALAINPPSDIVLGVANAADPQKLQAAAAQLARIGGATAANSASQTGADTGALRPNAWSSASKAQPVFDPQALASTPRAATPAQHPAAKRVPDVYTKFEAFLVQTFVESMLPSDAPNVFGSGTAGKIWKSMLAEHLANEIAQSTAFGIADRIAKHRQSGAKADAPGVTAASRQDAPASAAKTSPILDPDGILGALARHAAATPARRDLG
jgi:flagellar protein FlgJ